MFIESDGLNSYIIKDLNSLSQRKQYKFRIFLSTMKDAEVLFQDDSAIINYSSFSLHHINELFIFLSNLDDTLSVSNEIALQLEQINKIKAEKESTVSTMLSVKNTDLQDNQEYEEFKAFCNKQLSITLRDYQSKAAFLLYLGKGGFDFSVPGAGKTIIAYTAYAFLKHKDIINHIFIIGPLSSYNAWTDEYHTCFGKHADFISLATEDKDYCRDYLCASSKYHHEITFINFEKIRLLTNEISAFLEASPTLLVIDEAHKIKSPNAKSTQAALDFSSHASARILLTGTPMPNGYEDLHTLMHVFSPDESILPYGYKKLKEMTKKGANQNEFERLKNSIAPYYSRISKNYLLSIGELQAPTITNVYTEMDSAQQELYNRLDTFSHKTHNDIDEDLLIAFKKAVLIRKMQISANPFLLKKPISESMDEFYSMMASEEPALKNLAEADARIMSLFADSSITRIVNQYAVKKETTKNIEATKIASSLVNSGKKVLIWDVFVQNMQNLYDIFAAQYPGQIEMINGSVCMQERQNALKRFREGDSVVLIANPATLAESISLHRVCQNAIYVNRNFNCAQFMQSKDRIHRINMPIGTTAHYFFIMNNNCIDESVDDRLKAKEQRMLSILDSDELIIGGAEMEDTNIMSNQDIEICFDRK